MPATLVVIDMQESFPASMEPDVIIGVTQEIVTTKTKGGAIVLVEYHQCGPSHSGFYKILKDYPNKSCIKKRDDDGSMEILRAIRRRGFNENWLRVCGVNADCCVARTVQGFLERSPDSHVDVVKSACGFAYESDWTDWPYVSHQNLTLV